MTDVRRTREQQRLLVCAARRGEVVFVKELAKYLDHSLRYIHRYVRKQGWMKKMVTSNGHDRVSYITALAAMKTIAHVRSIQGEVYLSGRDFHKERDKMRADKKRYAATRL